MPIENAPCDCECTGTIFPVPCPPPNLPKRAPRRFSTPRGQISRAGRPLRDGRGGDLVPDRPSLDPPRTTPIAPKNLPDGHPWEFDENDPGNPADPTPHVPVTGESPRFRTNTSPRGGSVATDAIRRATREGGILDTPNPNPGPRTTRPKRLIDTKFPTDTNDNSGPTPNPGDTVNNQ
jgi:hypothetical protein